MWLGALPSSLNLFDFFQMVDGCQGSRDTARLLQQLVERFQFRPPLVDPARKRTAPDRKQATRWHVRATVAAATIQGKNGAIKMPELRRAQAADQKDRLVKSGKSGIDPLNPGNPPRVNPTGRFFSGRFVFFRTRTCYDHAHAARQVPTLQPYVSRRLGRSRVVVHQALADPGDGGISARSLLVLPQRAAARLAQRARRRCRRPQGVLVG